MNWGNKPPTPTLVDHNESNAEQFMCSVNLFGEDDSLGLFSTRSNVTGDTDSVLAKELHELSLQEREKVFAEIHGVADRIEEDAKTSAERSKALEEELQKIRKKAAYERALFLSPRYVKDPAFRLMFLRAEIFDAEKAASRMVKYFEHKQDLFGEDKLVKRITLDDLDADDISEIKTSSFQFLPQKDRSGRSICFVVQKRFNYKTWESKLRGVWYSIMSALEDEDAQRNGIVNVYYNLDMGAAEKLYFDLLSRIGPYINDSLPYRNVATHYCYNNPGLRPALQLLQMAAGRNNRLRFRTHFGSNMECRYSLMTFGIPKQVLPVDGIGRIRPEFIKDFFNRRHATETAQNRKQSACIINFPSKNDVLLGRGKPYQEYSGNLVLANVIAPLRDKYQTLERFDKTCMAMDLTSKVKELGVRFLQRDEASGGWVEVDDVSAREKVSSGFRTKPRRYDANHRVRSLEAFADDSRQQHKRPRILASRS